MTTEPQATSGVIDIAPTSTDEAHEAPAVQPERDHRARVQTHSRTLAVPAKAAPYSAFVPLLLGGLAVLGWLGFQTQQLFMERQALQTAYASQQPTVDNAGKLRASLDALAADTQRMADGGNPNARALVDELKKRGVTINAATTPAGPGLAAPAPAR